MNLWLIYVIRMNFGKYLDLIQWNTPVKNKKKSVLAPPSSAQTEAGKKRFSELVSCHSFLFGFKFWSFNFGDYRPTLKPVFGVQGRSIHLIPLRVNIQAPAKCVVTNQTNKFWSTQRGGQRKEVVNVEGFTVLHFVSNERF